jgi:hypothetical protein
LSKANDACANRTEHGSIADLGRRTERWIDSGELFGANTAALAVGRRPNSGHRCGASLVVLSKAFPYAE